MNWSALTFNWWLIIPALWTLPAIYFLVRFGVMNFILWRSQDVGSHEGRLRMQQEWCTDMAVIIGITLLLDMFVVLARVLP